MSEQRPKPEAGGPALEGHAVEQIPAKTLRPREPAVRWLTPDELADLRRDMAESSAWMRAELKRRRARRQDQKHVTRLELAPVVPADEWL